jgi:phosphoribosylanthranilate isomerase
MLRIKICGITELEDARHAIHCGADALGFVFFAQSPRCIGPERAAEIIRQLPPFVATVGLFVNEDPVRVREIAQTCRLDAVQLHGDESPEACAAIPGRKVIKALRVRDEKSLAGAGAYDVSALLLDAWVPGRFGGTGTVFNWQLAAEMARSRPVILAGGLNPVNVGEAVRAVRPYAVDVSSGVESSPGKKDRQKVAEFVAAARKAGGEIQKQGLF